MYGKITFQISGYYFDYRSFLNIFKNLSAAPSASYTPEKTVIHNGWELVLSETSLDVSGDLSAFCCNGAQAHSSFDHLKNALDELEAFLNVPLWSADINSLEIAYDIRMDYPVGEYLKLFDHAIPNLKYTFLQKGYKTSFTDVSNASDHILRFSFNLLPERLAELNMDVLELKSLYLSHTVEDLAFEWHMRYQRVHKFSNEFNSEFDKMLRDHAEQNDIPDRGILLQELDQKIAAACDNMIAAYGLNTSIPYPEDYYMY